MFTGRRHQEAAEKTHTARGADVEKLRSGTRGDRGGWIDILDDDDLPFFRRRKVLVEFVLYVRACEVIFRTLRRAIRQERRGEDDEPRMLPR